MAPHMPPGKRAEALALEFGVSHPKDIDVEAIAWASNLEVRYEPLVGCDAALVGYKQRAIATVRLSRNRGRERFSVAHELGHWLLHRGRSFRCRADEPDENLSSEAPLEREADEFASHLLLPGHLFNPRVVQARTPGFAALQDIAVDFETSLLATAIRLVKVDTLPVLLACYRKEGQRWHLYADHIPRRWWLKNELDEDSFAYDLLHNGRHCPNPRKQAAETWFDNRDASEFEVLEQCIGTRDGEALVLVYLTDPEMFERGFDPDVGDRRYNAEGSYVRRRPSK